MFRGDDQPHALLGFVADDLLHGEGGVADGQLVQVDLASGSFHQFREAVQVAAGAVVMDGYDWIGLSFHQAADGVGHALLHLRVGALNGVEFYARAVSARIGRRDGCPAHADAVVVAAQQDDLISGLRFSFQGLGFFPRSNATGQHNHLVEAQLAGVFFVFEGQERTRDQGLAEFIAEVGGAVGSFDQNVHRRLVEPGPFGQGLFPGAVVLQAGVGRHVNGRSGQGQRALPAGHPVADFPARAGGGAVKGFDGGGKIMGFGLQGNDRIEGLLLIVIRLAGSLWRKLVDPWAFQKGDVVFVGGDDGVGMCFRRFLDQG